MHFTNATKQGRLDYELLQLFLLESLYSDADKLYETDPITLLELLFTQYYDFLYSSFPLLDWYRHFHYDAHKLLMLRGYTPIETDYLLRSVEFVTFAQLLMSITHNEVKLDVPSSDANLSD